MLPDDDASDVLRKVDEATRGLFESQLLLRQTFYAIRRSRRTPYQIDDLLDRCERLRTRLHLLRRRHAQLSIVH